MITSSPRPKIFKEPEKQREGRGFSRDELREAGSSIREALRFRICIDHKRKTAHQQNIDELKRLMTDRRASWKPKPKPESKKPEAKEEVKRAKLAKPSKAKPKPKAKSKK